MSVLVRNSLLGAVLIAASWLALRLRLRAKWRPLAPLLFDAAVLGWCASVLLALTARPLLAGCVVAGAAAGLVLADRVKRDTLHEPLIFADRAELLELVRHPRLYLPFAGTGLVLAGAGALLALSGGLAALEPALPMGFKPRLAVLVAGAGIFRGFSVAPVRRRLAAWFAGWPNSADPAVAMRRLGMLGGFVVQATRAAQGRPARQYRHLPNTRPQTGPNRPLVLVQVESFFDVRRLDLGLGERCLPHYAALAASCVQHGRLAVPCWGANTVRTEFAVLTGIDPGQLGLDGFNPYERFARGPVESLAWRLRGCGYHTICVHPFDTRFYGRRHVLPQLGFNQIIGPEAFDRPPRGAFVSDRALAALADDLLRLHGPLVFIFVVTMQTHGPWALPRGQARRRKLPGGEALHAYLRALSEADAALPGFADAVGAADGVLALYGDHQPSLPRLASVGIATTETDYVIWDARGGLPRRQDLPAHGLAEAMCAISMRPRLRLLQEAG